MITTAQEQAMANRRAKVRQDKTHPHVVNIHNGRLMPNIERLRSHPDYRIYGGPMRQPGKPEITDAQRLAWVNSAVGISKTRIVDSSARNATKTFDVGTADKDDLILFAADELGLMLDSNKSVEALRAEVVAYDAKTRKAEPEDLAG